MKVLGVSLNGGMIGVVICGAEMRRAATESGGRSRWSEPETGISLLAGARGLIEHGAVEFGANDVVGAAGIKSGGRTQGKRVEFRLGQKSKINGRYGIKLKRTVGGGGRRERSIDGGGSH